MEKNNLMNHDPTRCAICGIILNEGLHDYFCAVCWECDRKAVNSEHFEAGHISAVPREDGSFFLTDDGDNPVFIEGIRCWRRYQFGGYITMRDLWDSPDLKSFYENMLESRKKFSEIK